MIKFGQKNKEQKASDLFLQIVGQEIEESANEDMELNIETLDKSISIAERLKIIEQMDSKDKSEYKKILLNGGISLTAILLVLNYEQKDVIASKAFGMATKLIGR